MQKFYQSLPIKEASPSRDNGSLKSQTFKRTSIKAGLTLLFLFFIGFQSAFAHAVQVGYAVLSNGFIRVYIEHWHGDQTTATLVNNGMSITTTYGSTTVTQNVNPTGAFNNIAWNNLPGAGASITILSKGASANQYNDWAYYDFAPAACNVPVQITLNGGLTVVLTEEQGGIWPRTITGTFNDTAAPTITASNTTASVSCNTTGTTVNFSATAIDNCTANPAVTYSIAPGSFFPVGTTNVTAYSTDANGNSGQLTFPVTVSVLDNVNPNLSVPASIFVNNTPGVCGAIVTYPAPLGTDACSTPTTVQTAGLTSGSVFPVGTTVNTFKTTDAAGNFTTASFSVTVNDTEAPVNGSGVAVISIPAGRTNGWSPYTYSFANQVPAGSVITSIDLSYSAVDQGWGGTGDWTNMQVAGTRIGGNQLFHHTQSFNISFNGSIPNYSYGATNNTFAMYFTGYQGWVGYFHGGTMTIHYEKDIPVVTAECSVSGISAPTTTDNCDGIITGTTTDPLSYSAQGSYEINWSFKDSKGNSSVAKQKVVIKDSTAPVAPVLADVTAECSATVSAVPTAIDNCAGIVTGTTTDSLTYKTQGTHVITWSFNDGNGNISTATQNVIIKDITAPVVPVLADVIVECSATVAVPTTSDNCAGTISGTTVDALTYTSQGTHVITWKFNDGNGNVTTASQNVIIKDTTAPVVPVLADVTGECSATATAPTTTDNCAGTITGTTTDALTYTNQGSYVITWNFNDGNGNVSTAAQNILVKDITAPTVLTNNITVQLDAYGQASITEAQINNGSTDNCAIATYSLNKTSFNCSNVGANTVSLSVTDVNGNIASSNAIITVQDNIAPIVNTQNITVQLDNNGQVSITESQINNGSTDNCTIASYALNKKSFDCSNIGTNAVVLTVTDVNGNATTGTATVTVQDNIAPVALAKNISVTLVNGSASVTAASVDNGSNDACGIQSLSIDRPVFDCSNLGNNTVVLTVTDKNGNVSSASAIVNVIGVTPVASISESRSDNTFTGLDSKTIALGYGAQKLTLTASNSTSASNATTYVWSPAAGLSNATIANPVFTPTAAGTYTFNVIATNEFGCSASTSITINVIDVRSGNKGDKVLVCHKAGNNKWTQISISASAVNTHLLNGGYLGACNSPATIAAAPSSELALTNDLTVNNSNTLSAYPNPFAGQTTVTFKLVSDQANASLDLYDLKGVKVKNVYSGSANALQAYSFNFDGSSIPSGVYFFKLSGNNVNLNFKVIVNQ